MTVRLLLASGILLLTSISYSQNVTNAVTEPQSDSSEINALLDAAGPSQRKAIESVYIIFCGTVHGTGFLMTSGIIVTNTHVIESCTSDVVLARSSRNREIHFKKVITDSTRDLALLVPSESLKGGLELGSDKPLKVGTNVTTWGFPLIYTSGAPLLTVGYISGYNSEAGGTAHVKHLVVNGAFNPGNSGGPVFVADDNKVIGIVVWRHRLTSNNVPVAINGLKHPRGGMMTGTFTKTLPDGRVTPVMDSEVVGDVLEEFYNLVQVQIGEAISVSELRAFIDEKKEEIK